jgi:hypothetical protein
MSPDTRLWAIRFEPNKPVAWFPCCRCHAAQLALPAKLYCYESRNFGRKKG